MLHFQRKAAAAARSETCGRLKGKLQDTQPIG